MKPPGKSRNPSASECESQSTRKIRSKNEGENGESESGESESESGESESGESESGGSESESESER